MIKSPSHAVKIGEASKILGLHTDTLRRWEKNGKITPIRTPGGTRLYSLDELHRLVPQGAKLRSVPKAQDDLPKPSITKTKPLPVKEDSYVHVYNKGAEKRTIFNDSMDYEVFLGFLKDYLTAPQDPKSIKKTFKVHGRIFQGTPHQPKNYFNQIELIAYNLMPDHFHLLLRQITSDSIESFLRSLCTRYSMYFNKKYQHTGALFEGPYKSIQIPDESRLLHLTRYLHHTRGYSSYGEYLGTKETSWVKVKKGTNDYRDFLQKYGLDQKEKELIEDFTIESETQHLEKSGLAEADKSANLKLLQRIPEFSATLVVFLLLVALGVRNIAISTIKSPKPSPPSSVLSVTKKIEKVSTASAKPKRLTIKIDGSESVIIRQKPTTDSDIISLAKSGDTFEFVSSNSGWYEVKLIDGSTGFISAQFIEKEEINNQ